MRISRASGKRLQWSGMIAAMALVAGCASTQPQPVAGTPPTGAGNVAAASAVSETPRSSADLAKTASLAERAARNGFRMEVLHGKTLYCWTDKDTGTLLPTTKCLTPSELESELELREQRRASMMQAPTRGACSPTLGC